MESTDQQIAVSCPSCGKEYRLPPSARGKSAKCGCGNRFVVEPKDAKQAAVESAAEQDEHTDVVGAPSCVHHALESAIAICIKCNSPICKQCSLRTKSGKHVCRPCAQKHAATSKPAPSAADSLPPSPAPQSPEPEVEVITDAMVIEEFASVSPGANEIADFLGDQQSSAASDDLFADLDAFPAVPTSPSVGIGSNYAPNQYQASAGIRKCAQHPQSPVAGVCAICSNPVCGTCLFAFPNNLTCCPECAANTDYPISPHRKIMIYASLGCAICATLVLAFLCSGLLGFLGETIISDVILEGLVIFPLCLGIGFGFGSWNSQEGNPVLLWVGGIWNSLGLAAWLGLLAMSVLSNLVGG